MISIWCVCVVVFQVAFIQPNAVRPPMHKSKHSCAKPPSCTTFGPLGTKLGSWRVTSDDFCWAEVGQTVCWTKTQKKPTMVKKCCKDWSWNYSWNGWWPDEFRKQDITSMVLRDLGFQQTISRLVFCLPFIRFELPNKNQETVLWPKGCIFISTFRFFCVLLLIAAPSIGLAQKWPMWLVTWRRSHVNLAWKIATISTSRVSKHGTYMDIMEFIGSYLAELKCWALSTFGLIHFMSDLSQDKTVPNQSHATFGKPRGDYAEQPADYLKKMLSLQMDGINWWMFCFFSRTCFQRVFFLTHVRTNM